MGTRHQIYIIAKVGDHYRVVAVFHLQSLYPPSAVHLAWCLVQLIEKHAEPLQKELHCLTEDRYAAKDAEYPCPYLSCLLFQRVQDFYGPYKNTYPEGVIDNDPWTQDNNSGFTVIDVTHPFTPAICFWGTDAYPGHPAGYPIAPEDYAIRYYVDPNEENKFEELDQEVQDAIRRLENQPFIDDRMILDEAWSKWIPFLDEMEEESLSKGAEEFMAALRTAIEAGSTENAQRMADTLSATPEVVEGLRHVLHSETLPEHCNPILVRVFSIAQGLSKSDELLDLRWMQLSPIQILQVVQAIIQNDSFKISSLDISGNSAITVETLSEIFRLEKAKEIKRVFLFGCTKVEGIRRGDMPGRIGADEAAEVFNSYFPTSLSEFRPWDTSTGSDDD